MAAPPGMGVPAVPARAAPLDTRVVETHISTVLLCRNRAYKLFKPVSMGFLDYSDEDARIDAVENELELNRRIAPRVYLGMADVVERGRIVDRILVMERMPDDRRLPVVLQRPGWEAELRKIARAIAGFHAGEPPAAIAEEVGSRDAVLTNWRDNFAAMEPFVGTILDVRDAQRVRTLVHRYLDSRHDLFGQRIRDGFVRDGHGDLTAEDIFCLDDGPQILDCLAFSDRLRIADVLNDVAFLAMDLDRLAGPAAARRFMTDYVEFSNEHHPASLAHHYVAYRAHVRCKVALLRYAQGDVDAAPEAQDYHELSLRHLGYAAARVVLVGGGPGTGKSTLSRALSERHGWMVLNSDELRKDLTGHGHADRTEAEFEEGIYAPEITEQVYCALLDQAAMLLSGGESVVIDATWPATDMRRRARELALQWGATIIELECVLPPRLAEARVAKRNLTGADGPSDATPAILDRAMSVREPWPEAHRVSNEGSPEETIEFVCQHVLGRVIDRTART